MFSNEAMRAPIGEPDRPTGVLGSLLARAELGSSATAGAEAAAAAGAAAARICFE